MRAFAATQARRAGLPADRARDLVIAVSELAANTWRHTDAGGTLHIWAADGEVLCQVHDSGHISDPLAGRRRPIPEAGRGNGLWVVNQLCDLVELRTGSTGTTFRLHIRLRPGADAGGGYPSAACSRTSPWRPAVPPPCRAARAAMACSRVS